MNTLYLKLIPIKELCKQWNTEFSIIYNTAGAIYENKANSDASILVRCNAKGDIDWNNTAIYSFKALVDKKVMFK